MNELREVHAPYVGLRPFESHETPIFFGREKDVSRLLEVLQRERFLAVTGSSGCGKSSLIRAGLLPALSMGLTGQTSDWRVAIMRPGERPLARLASALVAPEVLGKELLGTDLRTDSSQHAALIEAELRRGPLGLIALFEDARRRATLPFNLLVLVDQFEEIFPYAETGPDGSEEADAFINAILQPQMHDSEAALSIFVVLTLRSDAIDECVRFHDLPEAINRAPYITPRLRREEMQMATTHPAKVFGGGVDATVANEVLNGVYGLPDQLPVLQHAMARLWHLASQRQRESPNITVEDLRNVGGVAGALSQHADSVLEVLSSLDQLHAEVLFRAITSIDGQGRLTRRPKRLADVAFFAGGDPNGWSVYGPVLSAFAEDGQLLQFADPIDQNTVVDVSHEALIRNWKRLREWVEKEAAAQAGLRGLEVIALNGQASTSGSVGGGLASSTHPARQQEERSKPRVHVSYSHEGESQQIVDQIGAALQPICDWRRDILVLRAGDWISRFMDEIGDSNCVVIVLSAKYLESPYCMRELLSLYQTSLGNKSTMLDRIVPVVLPSACISRPEDRLRHVRYWKERYNDIEAAGQGLSVLEFGETTRRELLAVADFKHHVADMLAWLTDTLMPRMSSATKQGKSEFLVRSAVDLVRSRIGRPDDLLRLQQRGASSISSSKFASTKVRHWWRLWRRL